MTNLFGHSVRSELLALSLIEALLCFLAFYAILALGIPAGAPVEHSALLLLAGSLALCGTLASGATGLYQPSNWLHTGRLAVGTLLGGLLLLFVVQLLAPRLLPGAASAAGAAEVLAGFVGAVLVTRAGFLGAVQFGLLRRRVAVLAGPDAERLRAELRADPVFQVAAEVRPEARDTLPELRRRGVGVVLADDPSALPATLRAQLAADGVRVWAATEFLERRLGRVDLDRLPPDWLSQGGARRPGPLDAPLRRVMDILLSLLLIALALPVLLVAALAIKLDSPGPLLYRQRRVGLHGREFTLYKFRSMTADAEKAGAPVWARANDPRITRVGRILRRTRVDEIPQVLNVLRGDMAFVGPRPERPEFVARLAREIPRYNDRAAVRPGITGWAQVNFPYGASVEDARMKLTYDLYYVRRRSLFLDLLILVATVRVVLFQEGSR